MLPQALGHIAARGEPRALEALLEMTAEGSNGGVLAAAAARSSQPAALRDDLLEMAVRGLALARDERATERVRDIAAGEVRPAPGGRDLRVGAGRTMEALELLQGRSVANRAVEGRTGGELEVVSDGDMSAAREAVVAQVDAVFDGAHTTVKHAALTLRTIPTSPTR